MKAFDRGQCKRPGNGGGSGFTLVELMIVIVIMVILAAAAVPLFNGYAQRAKDSKAIAECRQVVQAAQVKANDLYAAGTLEITQTNNSIAKYNEEIKKLADVKGQIEDGPTVDGTAQITFVMYECENGTRVRYDVTKNPKYAVETAEAPLTVIKDWTKTANDYVIDFFKNNNKNQIGSYDRYKMYQDMIDKGQIKELPVDKEIKGGTPFENTDLYWRPYYIGNNKVNAEDVTSVLYAVSQGNGGWKASLVYVDGDVYVSTQRHAYNGTPEGANIANLKDCETTEAVRATLLANGFVLKE